MSDVYAVLTHSKYLINQEQNSFHSVKKSSSGNKYMKSDLYIKKALLVTTKKNRFCYKSFQHSAFLNLFDEYSYIFSPNWGSPIPFQRKGGKKPKGPKYTGDLLLPTATSHIDLENTANHLDFGLFFSVQLPKVSRVPLKKKKNLLILESIQLPLNSISDVSATIWFSCDYQNNWLLCLS